MIEIIVITHGLFGRELVRTAQDIVGRQDHVRDITLTSEMGTAGLSAALDQVIHDLPPNEGILIFVDMLGGTPCNAALLRSQGLPAEVITGVNLYMLISAFRNRPQMNFKDLVAKVVEDGKKSILLAKDLLLKKTS